MPRRPTRHRRQRILPPSSQGAIGTSSVEVLRRIISESSRIWIKRLSLNDRSWAFPRSESHQAGIYVPPEIRENFFLTFSTDQSGKNKNTIPITTAWKVEEGQDILCQSNVKTYTRGGKRSPESHLTSLPKEPFALVSPSSYFVAGANKSGGVFPCTLIDSQSDTAGFLEIIFALGADFNSGWFDPPDSISSSFIKMALAAHTSGQMEPFVRSHSEIPATSIMAKRAQDAFLAKTGRTDLNPFELQKPGDDLRQISQEIEFQMFRTLQMEACATELFRLLAPPKKATLSIEELISKLMLKHWQIDGIFLRAAQQRKARAGYSFESHIEQMLRDGSIAFEAQRTLPSKSRPDFILPSFEKLKSGPDASILSVKTTLRERWRQDVLDLQKEYPHATIYLGTVDPSIAKPALQSMAELNVTLVVPESFKSASGKLNTTEYAKYTHVISFKSLFQRLKK